MATFLFCLTCLYLNLFISSIVCKVTFALGVLSERKEETIFALFKLAIMRGRFFSFSHMVAVTFHNVIRYYWSHLCCSFVLVVIGGVVWVICISSCDQCGARNCVLLVHLCTSDGCLRKSKQEIV